MTINFLGVMHEIGEGGGVDRDKRVWVVRPLPSLPGRPRVWRRGGARQPRGLFEERRVDTAGLSVGAAPSYARAGKSCLPLPSASSSAGRPTAPSRRVAIGSRQKRMPDPHRRAHDQTQVALGVRVRARTWSSRRAHRGTRAATSSTPSATWPTPAASGARPTRRSDRRPRPHHQVADQGDRSCVLRARRHSARTSASEGLSLLR
jgi:hypothetical protein